MGEQSDRTTKPNRATTVALLVTLADTTWRMLLPSALFVAVGIYADLHLDTKPWLTILSVVVGLGASALLIRGQIGRLS